MGLRWACCGPFNSVKLSTFRQRLLPSSGWGIVDFRSPLGVAAANSLSQMWESWYNPSSFFIDLSCSFLTFFDPPVRFVAFSVDHLSLIPVCDTVDSDGVVCDGWFIRHSEKGNSRWGPCTNYITLEGRGVGSRLRYIRILRWGWGLDRALYNARQIQVVHGS